MGKAVVVIIAVIILLILVGLFLLYLWNKRTAVSEFKSGFANLATMEPLTRFYVGNNKVKNMYLTQLNVDVGEAHRVYREFVGNPGKQTPKHIYHSAVEILEFIEGGADMKNHSVDTDKLTNYLINMDAALTDVLNSKYYTADRLDGKGKYDQKLLKEYMEVDSDIAYNDFINAAGPNQDEADIREDAMLALGPKDFDIGNYVQSLEMNPDIVGQGVKSTMEAFTEAGKRNRLANRPYVGAANPRVIAEDDPLPRNKYDVNKDYNIPYPGVLTGKTRDIPSMTPYFEGRRGNRVYTGI
jgi:hypothetical protein